MAVPVLAITPLDANKAEGNSGTTPFTFTVTRTGDTSGTSTASWTVIPGGSPVAQNADFNGTVGSLTFTPGQTSQTITVNVVGDTVVEPNEQFYVYLSQGSNDTVDSSHFEALGTIINDDVVAADLAATSLTLGSSTITAGNGTAVTYSVTDQTATAAGSLVGFYRSTDTVFDGSDVLISTRSVPSLAAGQTFNDSFTLGLTTVGLYYIIAVADYNGAIAEGNESNNASNAVAINVTSGGGGGGSAVLSIAPLSADKPEGSNGGNTPFTFTVTRTGDTSGTSTANWTMFTGTSPFATADDFNGFTGTVTFAPGQTTQTITLQVVADTTVEPSENFGVWLTSATGATIDSNHATAVGVIQNDDTAPADLIISNPTLHGWTLTYTLANIGGANAGNSTTAIYLSVDSTITTSDTQLAFISSPSVPAGSSDLESVVLQSLIPLTLTSGIYYVGEIADFNSSLTEANYSNNASTGIQLILGDSNANTINGTPGNDYIDTFANNDKITGFDGFDVLTGGPGADIFFYENLSFNDANSKTLVLIDEITDYDRSSSIYNSAEGDQIDLSAILSSIYNHGSGQSVSSIVRAISGGTGTFLQIDIDGSSSSNSWITIARLDGIHVGNTINVVLDSTLPAGVTISVTRSIFDDFNGDLNADILWRDDSGAVSTWQMSDHVFTGINFNSVSASYHIVSTGDFNGDGITDILWRNDNGDVSIWDMHGNTFVGFDFGVVLTSWRIAGTGDFNGDGKTDILWRNINGDVAIWDMFDHQYFGFDFGITLSNEWTIAATGDFNGDGRTDILWRDNMTGHVLTWDMYDHTHIDFDFGAVPLDYHIAATGDFNGDGITDIVWRRDDGGVSTWDMNDHTFTGFDFTATAGVVPLSWHITDTGDFNSDGKTDLLWRNDSGAVSTWDMNDHTFTGFNFNSVPTNFHSIESADFIFSDLFWRRDDGSVSAWYMHSNTFTGVNFTSLPTSWTLAATGDFNGDGQRDLLWVNANGTVSTWDLNGSSQFVGFTFQSVPTSWHVAGTGDFNGDGTSDILWRNDDGSVSTWDMNDHTFVGFNFGAVPTSWHIAGTGDFNGDGKSDILWRNDNGDVSTWDMNDHTFVGFDFGIVTNDWHIAGTGDFNGDGKADILWRNDNGTVATWDMYDHVFTGFSFGAVGFDWHISGTGDFNGDGKTDIVWRRDSGEVSTWIMNDHTFTGVNFGVVSTDWHIVT